jgi:hypothetical protein
MLVDEICGDQAEMDELIRRWREKHQAAGRGDRVRLLTPLPRRTRLRLAIRRALTRAGEWLGDHVSWTATERLWRVTGLLGRKR